MRILIVGTGSIGQRHARNASRFAEVSVFDQQTEATETLSGVDNIDIHDSLEDALALKPDAAIVATPHNSHVPLAARLLHAGCAVMVEKPIAHDLESAGELIALAEELNRRLYVVCNMRFHPGPAHLLENIRAIGRIFFAHAYFGQWLPSMRPQRDYRDVYSAKKASGGGVILDNIHELDYLSCLLGPVKNARLSQARVSELEIDVGDYALVELEHENGCRASIQLDYLRQHKRRGCEIVGTGGSLIWESEGQDPEFCSVKLVLKDEPPRILYENRNVDANIMYVLLIEKFLQAVRGKEKGSLLMGAEAVKQLAIALGMKSPGITQV